MDNDTKTALKAALEFYADKCNYAPDIADVIGVNPGTGVMQFDISDIEADEGAKARDILRRIEHGGDEITDAGGCDKATVARVIMEKLYYNGQPEDAETQAALILCMLKLDEVIKPRLTDEAHSNGIQGMYTELKTSRERR